MPDSKPAPVEDDPLWPDLRRHVLRGWELMARHNFKSKAPYMALTRRKKSTGATPAFLSEVRRLMDKNGVTRLCMVADRDIEFEIKDKDEVHH